MVDRKGPRAFGIHGHSMSITPETSEDQRRRVFVVYGRNEQVRKAVFEFLRSLGLRPLEWSQAVSVTGQGSPYVGEVLNQALQSAQAIVVVMSPDDEAQLRAEFLRDGDPDYERVPTGQPRPNVIFEAGMAFAFSESRTILVQIGDLRPISDIVGRHTLRLTNSPESRQDLAIRLRTAGCALDMDGRDWLSAGNFSSFESGSPQKGAVAAEPPEEGSAESDTFPIEFRAEKNSESRFRITLRNASRETVVIRSVSFRDDSPFIVMLDDGELPVVLNPSEEWSTQASAIGAGRTEANDLLDQVEVDTSRQLPVGKV